MMCRIQESVCSKAAPKSKKKKKQQDTGNYIFIGFMFTSNKCTAVTSFTSMHFAVFTATNTKLLYLLQPKIKL